MVDYNNELYLKKGDNIKISWDCCRIIDDYGFNFSLKQKGENIEYENLKKLVLFED